MAAADLHPREGVALCLSGGGYRAALFHLGGLLRLAELGILSQVDTISSVSGGSMLAAQIAGHLVAHPQAWGQPGDPVAGFQTGIATPMVELTKRNVRTRAVLARFWPPWNLFRQNAAIDVLARELASGTVRAELTGLPDRPRFVFCATDVVFRVLWTFDSGTMRLGDGPAGHAPLDGWTIARATAASCCVPLLFKPMRVHEDLTGGTYTGTDRGELLRKIDLVDGGIYDDLGVEPVWESHATVLVSDGGPAFKSRPRIPPFVWRDLRYAITLIEQATEVRKRWFLAKLDQALLAGSYWGISSLPSEYGYRPPVALYSDDVIRCCITFVRDDLDQFSDGERAVLQNHGYLMADIAVHAWAPGLIRHDVPPTVPCPEWMDEAKVRRALAGSDKPRLRLFG